MVIDPKLKEELLKAQAERKVNSDRIAAIIEREGINKMSEDDMRKILITCDGKGERVKAIVLDTMLGTVADRSYSQGREDGEV